MLLLNKLTRSKAFKSSNGGGLRGIFPIVNSFASNCCHSSADNSLLGVNNFSEAGLALVAAAEAEVTGCPEALALCPNKALLEGEAEVATAALKAPKAGGGMVLAEFTAEALPKPEKPEVPKPPAVAAVLKEKEAADGAAGLPKPTDWGALGEDVAPNAGGFAAQAELPAAGLLPDDVELMRLELVLKEKSLALVLLLLLTGKLESPKLEVCCPPIPKAGAGCVPVVFKAESKAAFVDAFKAFN